MKKELTPSQRHDWLVRQLTFIRKLLEPAWSEKTSYYRDLNPETPSTGQCAVSALLVQRVLGGELVRTSVNGYSHYLNDIDGHFCDITGDQFGFDKIVCSVEFPYPAEIVRTAVHIKNKDTLDRADLLASTSQLLQEFEMTDPADLEKQKHPLVDQRVFKGTFRNINWQFSLPIGSKLVRILDILLEEPSIDEFYLQDREAT